MDILLHELAAATLRAGEKTLVAIGVGKLDGLTEKVARIGLFKREKAFAATTTQHVDLGLGLRRFFQRFFRGFSAARSCAHVALLLRGLVSGKSLTDGGFTAALGRLESNPT